jgi:hypothetical protein
MALTIEDGSGVAGANSFISLNDFLRFAEGANFALSDDDDINEGWLRRAAFAMQTMDWRGCLVAADQALPWPRTDVALRNGEIVAADAIPRGIVYGQAMLAIEMYAADTAASSAGGGATVVEESVKVGEIEQTRKFDLARRNPGSLPEPAAKASSRAQFADYLRTRGLSVVRA